MLIGSALATATNARLRLDLMSTQCPSVWVDLDSHSTTSTSSSSHVASTMPQSCSTSAPSHTTSARHTVGALLVGGHYQQWSHASDATVHRERGIAMERAQLDKINEQIHAAAENKSVVMVGDFNLDRHRVLDPTYGRRLRLATLAEATEQAGYKYHKTEYTWTSHGAFKGAHRTSCLDHVYTTGVVADVCVLGDAATDHRPVVCDVRANAVDRGAYSVKQIPQRNFNKAVVKHDLLLALEQWDWGAIHVIKDVDQAHKYLLDGVVVALYSVAPKKLIKICPGSNLYLAADTLARMRERDTAAKWSNRKGKQYKNLRNRVNVLVKRDKIRSNMAKLSEAQGNSRVLWKLADDAVGKTWPGLPGSLLNDDCSSTVGDVAAANRMNLYFVDKVPKLRAGIKTLPQPNVMPQVGPDVPHVGPDVPHMVPDVPSVCHVVPDAARDKDTQKEFHFSFANAGKIACIIAKLSTTGAIGIDGIPVFILKLGVDILVSPLAHVVNRSLASGVVPTALKKGIVHPVHKGKGKSRADPASYRPISILTAISKVLESVVK
jgi:hypothetical protein